MSEDKEKKVLEQTRRNYSAIHSLAGNIEKSKVKVDKRTYDENEVKNPIKAVAILVGTTIAFVAVIYILYQIAIFINK